MKKIEDSLKEMIISKYGTISNFSSDVGIANSTIAAILHRGISNANVSSITRICKALSISTEALVDGRIVLLEDAAKDTQQFNDINEITTFLKITLLSNKNIKSSGDPLTDDDIQIMIDAFELSCELVRRKAMRRRLMSEGL